MARTFGKDGDDSGDGKKRQRRQRHPPNDGRGDEQPLEGAVGGVGHDLEALPLPPPEVIREEADEGRHLLVEFVREEISRHSISIDENCPSLRNEDDVTPEKYGVLQDAIIMMQWMRAGRELRQLADAFSRSKERHEVRRKAENVPLEALDAEYFLHLLQELFQGGAITRERIIVLFFFCADVAIQALKNGFHSIFHKLLDWSIRYISTNVAAWVHASGGWGVVLRSSLDVVYQISACCAFVAVVAACVVYIRRNI